MASDESLRSTMCILLTALRNKKVTYQGDFSFVPRGRDAGFNIAQYQELNRFWPTPGVGQQGLHRISSPSHRLGQVSGGTAREGGQDELCGVLPARRTTDAERTRK